MSRNNHSNTRKPRYEDRLGRPWGIRSWLMQAENFGFWQFAFKDYNVRPSDGLADSARRLRRTGCEKSQTPHTFSLLFSARVLFLVADPYKAF